MAEIIPLRADPISPDDLLAEWEGEMKDVVLVGVAKDGSLRVEATGGDVLKSLGMLHAAAHGLMHITEE